MTDKEILEANEASRQPVECWTRVMGYFRPYSQFNKGKKSEFDERVWFTEENACPCAMDKAV
ncbi:MAG: anaerobic ribonucleoside-triphosphate reductase [Pseudomonadota bacterium]|nr:anaerobic ribonucleoside-triphosphate reductase [Pseudomonadota bacterium]